jgi:nucleotide sugar dehydrogenase
MTQSTELIHKITDRKATISVIGLGYVGLPTAVFFAEEGFRVIGADLDEAKVQAINNGRSPLHELDLDTQLADAVTQGRLSATTDVVQAVRQSDICLIIVPTPVTEAKEPDLRYVQAASRDVRDGLHQGMLIVLESTTYPGTTEEIVQPILEEYGLIAGVDFGLAYCPERYNPGDAAHPIRQVARVVGGITPEWTDAAVQLYQSIIDAGVHPFSSLRTAVAAKIIENIQRYLNIALMNELALIV